MTEPDTWKELLGAELQALPPEERFLRAGEYISWITYTLLPDLGAQRRDCIVDLIDDGWDILRIAGHFGMRRSTVVRLLDEGRIPSHKVGTHRRALLKDVMAYREEHYRARSAVLDRMAAIDQELGLT